jgi:hypothetical protein
MLWAWNAGLKRPTMDIDMLGVKENEIENLIRQIREICTISVEDDGLEFDIESIKGEVIVEDADTQGVRILFDMSLDKTSIHMQIDIGYGDVIYPGTQKKKLPSILGFSQPILTCYSMESVIAEKFRAIIWFGEANSRMKDFYDIWLLSKQFDFDGMKLSEAVHRTLKNRKTELPNPIIAFSDEFGRIKAREWTAFKGKLKLIEAPSDFMEVIRFIAGFLKPILSSIKSGSSCNEKWKEPGFWR